MENENKQLNEISVGKNAVREAMRAGMIFDTVFISERTPALSPLLAECAKNGTVVKEVHPAKLNAMAGGANHQGVVGVLSCVKPAELDDIFASAEQKGQPPLILIFPHGGVVQSLFKVENVPLAGIICGDGGKNALFQSCDPVFLLSQCLVHPLGSCAGVVDLGGESLGYQLVLQVDPVQHLQRLLAAGHFHPGTAP
ncbi:MAG: hypothetical protein IJC25_01235, partial [Clostridia bacterium]|nr:hypothetical protein [Clostridia bacterium]